MRTDRKRLITEAVLSGLIGYVIVVAFFLISNVLAGRPLLHTPALLGSVLFGRPVDLEHLVASGVVFAFNAVHLAAFLVMGYAGAWMLHEAELHPDLWYLVFFVFVVVGAVGASAVLAASLMGNLPDGARIVGATVLAGAGMAAYLGVSHRSLIRTIRASGERPGTLD